MIPSPPDVVERAAAAHTLVLIRSSYAPAVPDKYVGLIYLGKCLIDRTVVPEVHYCPTHYTNFVIRKGL